MPEEDGWKIIDISISDITTMISYTHGDTTVIFEQDVIRNNMGNMNTENAIVVPMAVYEENDGFFIALNGGEYFMLYWIYDGYLLSILGNLNKDKLLNLAYSTKIVEF